MYFESKAFHFKHIAWPVDFVIVDVSGCLSLMNVYINYLMKLIAVNGYMQSKQNIGTYDVFKHVLSTISLRRCNQCS
jgi:hypothetical protein